MATNCKQICKIDYSPEMALIVGDASAKFAGYVHHWQKAMKREIWKSNEEIMQELGMGRYQFERARSAIATRVKSGDSKKELQRVRMEDGSLAPINRVILYWKDRQNKMWYWVNEELFAAYAGSNDYLLRTMPYSEYLRTDHWQTVRKRALKVANNRCQVCNAADRLQVHHRTYENRGKEKKHDVIVLCDTCHATFHKNGRVS